MRQCERHQDLVMVLERQAELSDSIDERRECYQEVAQLLTGDNAAKADDGVHWLSNLSNQLNIPALGTYGLKEADLPTLIEKSLRASSMKGNPIALEDDELCEILARAL